MCDVTRVTRVLQSSPFLFCFIVEFSLVGSTVFYNTWHNVHTLTRSAQSYVIEKESPKFSSFL